MKQSESIRVNYLTQLGLLQAPFADTGDDAFFYGDPERSKYLDMLQHLLQYSNDVLLLTGEPGSGKSTMLEKIIERADEQWLVCHLPCAEPTGADTLFTRVASCFDLQSGDDAEGMLDALYTQLDELHQQRFPILLLDDAQNLSEDALEMVLHLAQLDGTDGRLLHLVMAGDSELVERLDDKRFVTLPVPHRFELEGMGEAHSAAYLMQRLKAAGHNGDSPFSVAELKQLHKESDGIPGRLNAAANNLLNKKYGKPFSGSSLRRAVQAGLAATALLGTVLGFHDRVDMLFGGEQQEESKTLAVQQAEKTAAPTGQAEAVSNKHAVTEVKLPLEPVEKTQARETVLVVKKEPVQAEQPILVAKNESSQTVVPTIASEQESAEKKESDAGSGEPELLGTEPEKVTGSSKPVRLVLHGRGFRPGTKVALSRDGKVKVLQQDLVEFIDATKLAFSVTPGVKKSDWAVQVSTPDNRRSNVLHFEVLPPSQEEKVVQPATAEPAVSSAAVVETKAEPVTELPAVKKEAAAKPVVQPAAQAAKPQSKSTSTASVMGADWYSAQPKGNYTLQLLASASRTNINAYIRKYDLPEPLAQFSMKKGGHTLHVLTYGSFANRQAAMKAATGLPKGVKPWARTIASVRQVMLAEAVKKATPVSNTDTSPDAAWIWSQDPTHYTIQLAAGRNEKAVLMTKRQVTLPGELAVARAMRDGRAWYVLVYGSFVNKGSAHDTIKRLPAGLRGAGPWVRSFASLQDELSRSTPQ